MIDNRTGQTLHAKASKGESLSSEEQEQLHAWYQEQDDQEAKLLGVKADQESSQNLRIHIQTVLSRIADISMRIQQLISENDRLKSENVVLKKQLAHLMRKKSA